MSRRSSPQEQLTIRGFTLIEVAIAVAILGIGLTTLLSLQSRYIKNYQHEENLTQAALYAQYLMTMIEVNDTVPEPGTSDKPLAEALGGSGYFDKDDLTAKESLKDWRAIQEVNSIDIDPVKDALRQISVSVSWDDQPGNRFTAVLFVRPGVSSKSAAGTTP